MGAAAAAAAAHARRAAAAVPASAGGAGTATALSPYGTARLAGAGAVGGLASPAQEQAEAARAAQAAEEMKAEAESLRGLRLLLVRASQAAALLSMLADADAPPRAGAGVVPPVVAPGALMAKVVTEMPSAQRAKLGGLTFRDLVVPPSPKAKGGKADAAEVGKALPRLLIRHLEDFAAGAGERLQRECPDFYSSEDVKVAEAHKLLAEARRLRSPPRLTDALRVFARVVSHRDQRADLDRVAAVAYEVRGAAGYGTSPSALVELDGALANLFLAAAAKADPKDAAVRLLVGTAAAGAAPDEPGAMATWPAEVTERLGCYAHLLRHLSKLARRADTIGETAAAAAAAAAVGLSPMAGSAASGGGAAALWMQPVELALSRTPLDACFVQAAAWWLLACGREEHLLSLASQWGKDDARTAALERFIGRAELSAPLRAACADAYGAAAHGPPAAAAAANGGAANGTGDNARMVVDVASELSRGALLPKLLLRQQRHTEAAAAFLRLAVRAAPAENGGAEPDQRILEGRISHFRLAHQTARTAGVQAGGAAVSAALGDDFLRFAEESEQRAQLQLRIAVRLRALTRRAPGSPPKPEVVEQLAPELITLSRELSAQLGRPVDALKLWEEKQAELSAACADRLELWPLLRIGWNSRLWECVLAVLDFAKAEHSYPEYVRTALQHQVAGGDGWVGAAQRVRELRERYGHDEASRRYIFQTDTICKLLETRRAESGGAVDGADGAGAVPLLLRAASPPVAWDELYRCYGGASVCGEQMAALWAADDATRLRLLGALGALLSAWVRAARADGSRRELTNLVFHVRQLGIGKTLDDHGRYLQRLGGTQPDDLARALGDLRRDLDALSAL